MNGRKSVTLSGRLRNSTIFRCAKNWDSNSPRRKLPERVTDLSSGLIVHRKAPPAVPLEVLTYLFFLFRYGGFRAFPDRLGTAVHGQSTPVIAGCELRLSPVQLGARVLAVCPFESVRSCLAEATNPGLSASTVRVPKIAQQFWSSCAAAGLVAGAMADSKGQTASARGRQLNKPRKVS